MKILYNLVFYSPWWRHVREFWEIREQDNVLFLKYEDIVQVFGFINSFIINTRISSCVGLLLVYKSRVRFIEEQSAPLVDLGDGRPVC